MKADFVSLLRCPARDCNAQELRLHAGSIERIEYKGGAIDEVREGTIECPACGRHYPIQEFVLSFEQLYPEGLKREAEYWGKWYGFMWERGYTGFFDIRNPVAPLITEGIEVLNPGTVDGIDIGGTHSLIADHPLLADAERLLDIGSGTGWSSLYFARRGHKVVAFDPAVANMRLAKRYAISQGEYIEYMGAAMGFLDFKPGVFDGAVALHSIHHVPNLVEEMAILKGWLKNGAGIGIDEHVRNNEYLEEIMSAARKWAQEEIYPGLRTLDPEVLAGIPRAEPSEMEAVGSEQVIEAFVDNFEVDSFDGRYIAFDSLSWLYYLAQSQDKAAYDYASGLLQLIYRFLIEAQPQSAEHVMLIGHKSDGSGSHGSKELREQALRLSRGRLDPVGQALQSARHEVARLQQELEVKNRHIKALEEWAHELERHLIAAQAVPPHGARSIMKRVLKRK
jgi:SAM-dependent methyltransferase/uncharacterized protein YbaR (Trm112 family)